MLTARTTLIWLNLFLFNSFLDILFQNQQLTLEQIEKIRSEALMSKLRL
jgi:hypothetical protein